MNFERERPRVQSAAHRGRTRLALTSAVAAAVSCVIAGNASANPMDLAPERLATCTGTGPATCLADHAAWAKLVSSYAVAMAPTSMHPARTTGYGGFEMSLFGSITTLSKGERYVQLGTEGPVTTANKFSSSNTSPDSVLQVYGVSGRKGLPYGFELQASAGYMVNTELVVLGGGIRVSPFEGFRKGGFAGVPDLSVGGYVNTLTGTNKVRITVPAIDAQLSKPFTIAHQLVIQPYLGWQMIWLVADSGVVDGTPQVNAIGGCNARPPSVTERAAGDTGEPHCQEKDPATGELRDAAPGSAATVSKLDLNNNLVFDRIRYRRHRGMIGVALRYELAHLILHATTDLASPESGGDARVSGLSRQWTFGMVAGVSW